MSDTRLVLTLHADGLEIPVEVTRKHVKNLNLRVRGDGSVALSIPQRLSFTRAQAFLDCKASWIIERVRRAQMRNTRISPTEGESDGDGRTSYPLWGDLTPLGPDHRGQDAIDNLYREELGRVLSRIAARLERRMGVHASRWSIRTMKTRWGSCTPSTGAIRITPASPPIHPNALSSWSPMNSSTCWNPATTRASTHYSTNSAPTTGLSPSVSGKAPFRLTRRSGAITTTSSRQNCLWLICNYPGISPTMKRTPPKRRPYCKLSCLLRANESPLETRSYSSTSSN